MLQRTNHSNVGAISIARPTEEYHNNKTKHCAKTKLKRVGAALGSPSYEETAQENGNIAMPTKNGRPKGAPTNSGITLIALIITIVLLLILAGVTLHFTLGENGILKNAEIAGNKYKEEQQKEKNALDEMYSSILVAEDSKVTLTMEQLDGYIKKRMEEENNNKANIKVTTSSSKRYTTSGNNEVKVDFDNIVGDAKSKFTLENGNIKVGAGVKKILISSYTQAYSDVAYTGLQMLIKKNNDVISASFNRNVAASVICSIQPTTIVIDVKEGDYISASINSWTNRWNICKFLFIDIRIIKQ